MTRPQPRHRPLASASPTTSCAVPPSAAPRDRTGATASSPPASPASAHPSPAPVVRARSGALRVAVAVALAAPLAACAPTAPSVRARGPAAAQLVARACRALARESATPLSAVELARVAEAAAAAPPRTSAPDADPCAARLEPLVLTDAAAARAVAAMAAAAGAATRFLDADQTEALSRAAAGLPWVGPGLVLARVGEGRFAVARLHPDGPAAAALHRGDIVRRVDESDVSRGNADLLPLVGRSEGARARLLVSSASDPERAVERTLVLHRSLPPIVTTQVISEGIAAVRLDELHASRDELRDPLHAFTSALADLDRLGVRALVLDLRGAGEGDAETVRAIASLLVPAADSLLVATGPGGRARPIARRGPAWHVARPLAVLVDDQTRGAAELLAHLVQVHHAGRLLGQPTGGVPALPATLLLEPLGSLEYPAALAPAAARVTPDEPVRNATAAELASGADPQLAAALVYLGGQL